MIFPDGDMIMKPFQTQDSNLNGRLLVGTAFLDYCALAEISNTDIDKLYAKIEKLNELSSEKDMELVVKYDLENLTSKDALKERIKQIRSQTAEKIFDYYALSEQNAAVVQGVMTRAGIKKDVAAEMTQAISERKLDAPYKNDDARYADKLYAHLTTASKKMKENLAADYQTYCDTGAHNPVIEAIKDNIDSYVPAEEKALSYLTGKSDADKAFRGDIRDNFKEGIRPQFVTLYGLMMRNGQQRAKNPSLNSNYRDFEAQLKKICDTRGLNYLDEADKALCCQTQGLSAAEARKVRETRYNQKSQEVYFKTAYALLSLKFKDDQTRSVPATTNYTTIADTIDNRFISDLCAGQTNVNCLALVEPDNSYAANMREERLKQERYKQDIAEDQHVSIHHKLPVGSAKDLVKNFKMRRFSPDMELESAASLVNTLGNMSLIIGKDVHKKLEADGYYKLDDKDDMIFAARINKSALEKIKDQLPAHLRNDENMSKYTQAGSNGLVMVRMDFSESPEVAKQRPVAKEKAAPDFVQKYQQIFSGKEK